MSKTHPHTQKQNKNPPNKQKIVRAKRNLGDRTAKCNVMSQVGSDPRTEKGHLV